MWASRAVLPVGLSAAPSLTSKALHEAAQPYWEGIAWYIHLPRGRNGAQRCFFFGVQHLCFPYRMICTEKNQWPDLQEVLDASTLTISP